MIRLMLSKEPSDRPSFDRLLAIYRGRIFPEYFYTFLEDKWASLQELPTTTDAPFSQRASPQPGTKIDRLLEEWDSLSVHLDASTEKQGDRNLC